MANRKRGQIGRGKFKWGPRINDPEITEVRFDCYDTFEEHPSDGENDIAKLPDSYSTPSHANVPFLSPEQEYSSLPVLHPNSHSLSPDVFGEIPIDEGGDVFEANEIEPSEYEVDCTNYEPAIAPPEESAPDDLSPENAFESDGLNILSGSTAENVYSGQCRGVASKSVLGWIKEQRDWVHLFYQHGVEQSVMDDIIKIIRAPVKSWKTVIANIGRQSLLSQEVQSFPTCPGHMCFAMLPTEELTTCLDCRAQRPSEDSNGIVFGGSVSYIPLLPRIASIMKNENSCKKLFQYHRSFCRTPGIHTDFFDSKAYDKVCSMYGREELEWDVFIAASTDRFQAYKNRSLEVWPILAVLLNLPPAERTSIKNVLPIMFIPGGRQPSQLQSFVLPLINEVNSTLPDGVPLMTFDGEERSVRLHLVWFSTDLDGLNKVASLNGHNGKTPCRFCLIQGVYCNNSRHYYFPCSLRIGNNSRPSIRYNPASLPLRSTDGITIAISMVEGAKSASERTKIARETGIKGNSVLLKVPTIFPYHSFPPDIMHLFYNVQKHLLSLHTGEFEDLFSISLRQFQVLDLELLRFKDGISGQLAPAPRRLSSFHSWKAAEHKHFSLSYALVLFDVYLPQRYLNGLETFSKIADICFQPVLTDRDIEDLSSFCVGFVRHFEAHYMRHDSERVKMSTYVMHLLLHLAEGVLENGPLVNYSQYWVEKYIGWVVGRLNAKRVPAESLRNSALFGESYKMFFGEHFTLNEESFLDLELGAQGFKLLGPTASIELDITEDGGKGIRYLLSHYFVRKYEGMNISTAKRVSSNVNICAFCSRVIFRRFRPAKFETASVSSRQSRGRASYYVAVEMDATETGADVYYGRLEKIIEFDLHLAHEAISSEFKECSGEHFLAVIKWARLLTKGRQGQIFFSRPSFECVFVDDDRRHFYH